MPRPVLRLQPDLDETADGVCAGRQVELLSAPFLNRTELWLMPANADERSNACSTGPTERPLLANSSLRPFHASTLTLKRAER